MPAVTNLTTPNSQISFPTLPAGWGVTTTWNAATAQGAVQIVSPGNLDYPAVDPIIPVSITDSSGNIFTETFDITTQNATITVGPTGNRSAGARDYLVATPGETATIPPTDPTTAVTYGDVLAPFQATVNVADVDGTGPYTVTSATSISPLGTLPAGLTASMNGSTVVISGTPSATYAGDDVIVTLTVTDTSTGETGSETFVIDILPPVQFAVGGTTVAAPAINGASSNPIVTLPMAEIGTAYPNAVNSSTITVAGGGPAVTVATSAFSDPAGALGEVDNGTSSDWANPGVVNNATAGQISINAAGADFLNAGTASFVATYTPMRHPWCTRRRSICPLSPRWRSARPACPTTRPGLATIKRSARARGPAASVRSASPI